MFKMYSYNKGDVSDLLESNQLPFDNHKAGIAKLLQSNALPNELKSDFIISVRMVKIILF